MSESWKFVKQQLERVFPESFTPINEVLSYGIDDEELHIHVEATNALNPLQKLKLFKEGLSNLAEVVEQHERVTVITATSWIVAEHPKLLESLGFVIDGLIDLETRDKFFPNESREISTAHITRTEFLRLYSRHRA